MTAATIGHASKPKSKRASSLWAENLSSFWFLLPIIIIFFILTVVPLAQSFFYSLTDYSENFSFVAFSNYVAIFKDPSLLSALGFTLLYAFGTTLLVTCFAIPLAVTLNKAMWGRSFARSLFFFLGVPAQAIIGLIWQYIFSPLGSGVMNKVIAVFGIPNIPWLADDNWARFCVISWPYGCRSAGTPPCTSPICKPSRRTCTNRLVSTVPIPVSSSSISLCRSSSPASSSRCSS